MDQATSKLPAWHGSLGKLQGALAYRLPGSPMSSAAQSARCAPWLTAQALTEPDSLTASPSLPAQALGFVPADMHLY